MDAQWSSPASSAAHVRLHVFAVPVPVPGQSTLASVQPARTPTGGGEGARSRFRTGRLEEVALGWRKAACGLGRWVAPLLGGGSSGSFLHKGRSSHQLSGEQTGLSLPLRSLSPASSPYRPPSLAFRPKQLSPRVKGQGFTRPGLFPALLLARSVLSP